MTKDKHDLSKILACRDEFRRRGTRVVAITIARGGSQRFPRKNLAPICGRPLVEWSIHQSLCSHLIMDTYLSTDDEEIANICRKAGAKIIWRYDVSPDISGCTVFGHAIRQIQEWHGVDIAVTILPTNPLKHPWDMDEAIRSFWEISRKNHNMHEMLALAKVTEAVLHKRLDGTRSQVIFGNKIDDLLDGTAASWNVVNPDWYVAYSAICPKTDTEVDNEIRDIQKFNRDTAGTDVFFYHEVEEYQAHDLDLPGQLPEIEAIMERYILTEPDVYIKYKAQGREPIEV